MRRLSVCLLAPGLEPGSREAYLVHGGRVAVQRDLGGFEAVAEAAVVEADRLDELLVVASFLDAPPPELTVVPLGEAA